MSQITATKLNDRTYQIFINSARLFDGYMVVSESTQDKVMFNTDLLNFWGDLMFVWHDNVKGNAEVDLSGNNVDMVSIPDPLWRELLNVVDPIARGIIDSTPQN